MYYRVYEQWKDFPKVIEYADKLVALGERVDAASRYAALYASTVAYNSMHSDDPKLAEDARGRALAAVALQSALKRPPMLDERAFADEKNRAAIYLHATAGIAALIAKDYAAATESFTAVMGLSKPHIRTTTTPK